MRKFIEVMEEVFDEYLPEIMICNHIFFLEMMFFTVLIFLLGIISFDTAKMMLYLAIMPDFLPFLVIFLAFFFFKYLRCNILYCL